MKKATAPFVNELRINAPRPIEPPTIGGKREAPPISGEQVRAAGNVAAQFGASLAAKPPRRR
jgi:hypothetical protein